MKAIKYLVAGALMLSVSSPMMAQNSALQQQIDAITKSVTDAQGDVKATKDVVKEFLKVNKKNPEALAGLGRAYMAAHNFTEATKYAEMARKVGKNVAAGYILQGDIFAVQDDGGNAATWYQQASEMPNLVAAVMGEYVLSAEADPLNPAKSLRMAKEGSAIICSGASNLK